MYKFKVQVSVHARDLLRNGREIPSVGLRDKRLWLLQSDKPPLVGHQDLRGQLTHQCAAKQRISHSSIEEVQRVE